MEIQKHSFDDTEALRQFVQDGFVIYENVFDACLVMDCGDFIKRKLDVLRGRFDDVDINGWSVAVMQVFERTKLYDDLIRSKKLVALCSRYVGPDVAWFSHDGLFVNAPQDKDPVTLKGQHTDVWTGTGVNTVFAATFFTDVDAYNGLSVCPGSHLQGLMPVRNRAIDPACGVELEQVNLDMVRAGDLVLWHPLLIHSTTGHSDKNIRISMTSRFTSTETPMTSQERALGYHTLSVGPLNQVLRLVGNDHLLPFRTYGGYVGVDRRMADVYNYSPYKTGIDYEAYLK